MSVLDTFWILFKADTSDLDKGAEKSNKIQGNLEDKIKSTQRSTEGLGLSFLSMAEQAAAAIATVVSLGAATKSIFDTERSTLEISRFSKTLGLSGSEVFRWGRALKDVAGESANIEPDIRRITDDLNRYMLVGGKITQAPFSGFLQAFLSNGVAITGAMKWSDVLLKTAERVDQMRDQMRSQGVQPDRIESVINSVLTKNLSLSPDMAMLLQPGSVGLKQLLEEIDRHGIPTQEDLDKINKFAMQWGFVVQEIQNFGRAVAGPVLDFLDRLPQLMKENSQQIKDFGVALGIMSLAFVPFVTGILIANAPLIIFTAALGSLYLIINKIRTTDLSSWARSIGSAFDYLANTKLGKLLSKGMLGEVNLPAQDKNEILGYINSGHLAGLAQDQMDAAKRTPITSQTSNSIVGGNYTGNKSISVGSVNVHTQATDSKSIAGSIGDYLKPMLSQVIANWDDGIHS